MFKWFKKSSKNLHPINFSEVGVDIHSHLIPGIDDGAKSLEDSISMIKELKNLGFSKIITTPHIMSDLYKNSPEIINSGLSILKERLAKEKSNIFAKVPFPSMTNPLSVLILSKIVESFILPPKK